MGRIPKTADRDLTIQYLQPHHSAMARAEACGARKGELAKRFGLQPSWVTQVTNSPLYKAEVQRIRSQLERGTLDVQKELQIRIPRSLEVIDEELFQPERSQSRTKSAFEILDRAGYSKQKEPQGSGDTYNIAFFAPMPGEDPDEAKARINSLKREAAIIRDIELVERPSQLPSESLEVEVPSEEDI